MKLTGSQRKQIVKDVLKEFRYEYHLVCNEDGENIVNLMWNRLDDHELEDIEIEEEEI